MTTFLSRCFRAWRGAALALLVTLPAVAGAQDTTGVGFEPITIHDPVGGGDMPGYVFYPAAEKGTVTWRGPYRLEAAADASPLPGAKPLVVISHGHAGSALGHHDLAEYLARHGFVVATLQHPRDNSADASGDGQPAVMIGRAVQVRATIDMLLADPQWKTLVDPARIGVAGFSNGGYTSLLVVGAVPRFTRFAAHCEAHPDDPGICGNYKQIVATLARQGQTPTQMLESMQAQFQRWGDPRDTRVRAAFAMAPLSLVFDETGLASIDRPVFLYYGEQDEVLRPDYNFRHIIPLMKTLAGVRTIPKAGHYVFLSPCSEELTKEIPDLCKDPAGVDRADVHARVDADALAFFRRTLAAQAH